VLITVELSGPPRGKGRGRATSTPAGTRVFTDSKTRTYEAQLRFAAQQEMNGTEPFAGPLSVAVEARFAIAPSWSRKKQKEALSGAIRPTSTPDADNLLKILDAFNGVVWVDDRQIVEAYVSKRYSDRPGLTVVVESRSRGAP
jgi:Holliday junction resolvase RusA-like endonuclease